MEIQRIKVEMSSSEDLISLRNYLLEHGSENLEEPEEIQQVSAGFQREPLLIAVIVALGGPVIVKELVSLVKEWMKIRQEERIRQSEIELEKYKMELETAEEIYKMRLSIFMEDRSRREVTFSELEALAEKL